jgi:hypothetical protein
MKKIYFVIVLMLTACTIINEKPSIIDDSSCDAPCWNEITVGVTTKEEMLAILKELPNVDTDSIAFINSPWQIYDSGINFFLYPNPIFGNRHDAYAESNIIKDKVVKLAFCGDIGLTFSDIVKETGEPKSLIIGPSPSGGLFVIAVNQDIGVQFWYDTVNVPKPLSTEVSPEAQIDCLVYFDRSLYKEMLEIGSFSMGHLNAEETLDAMYPWVGYGNIEEKYLSQK